MKPAKFWLKFASQWKFLKRKGCTECSMKKLLFNENCGLTKEIKCCSQYLSDLVFDSVVRFNFRSSWKDTGLREKVIEKVS